MIDGLPHTVVGVLPASARELAGRARRALARVAAARTHAARPVLPSGRRRASRLASRRMGQRATSPASASASSRSGPRVFRTAGRDSIPSRCGDALLRDATSSLRLFAAAVALVLLIAVANVSSLMLVRTIGRWREVSLRAVLGASRFRLLRLMVTESVVLAGGRCARSACCSARWDCACSLPWRRGCHALPMRTSTHGRVGFAIAVALLSGLLVGVAPVAHARFGSEASAALAGRARTVGGGRQTQAARSAFVVAQFALALPILAIAGLLLNSFLRLQREDPGFDPQHLLTLRVSLPSGRYATQRFHRRILAARAPARARDPGRRRGRAQLDDAA